VSDGGDDLVLGEGLHGRALVLGELALVLVGEVGSGRDGALDRVAGEPGSTIELPVLLLVDGDKITADAKSLASAKVTAEKIEDLRGPKIVIQKYKNKTGYKKRQGFRAELTTVKITAINA